MVWIMLNNYNKFVWIVFAWALRTIVYCWLNHRIELNWDISIYRIEVCKLIGQSCKYF